ncbi:GMC family oxidoreductase N-terminal domain-containing protein [Paenibacillus sp. P26]|nr:GMC family oxidoreductase N-terminal domain-containing protein [Paenibacillus sp. P26]
MGIVSRALSLSGAGSDQPQCGSVRPGLREAGHTLGRLPLAILSAPFEDRPPCINRGFCNQGRMPNAKFSTLIVHIPKAMRAGAEVLSDCTVTEIVMGKDGKAAGVRFVHEGETYEQTEPTLSSCPLM